MWVFGYGSLIWKVDFPIDRKVPAYITGHVRRFWQSSSDHRGTPENPGRVLTLIPHDEWSRRVYGVALRIPAEHAEAVKKHLDHREKDGYETQSVKVYDAKSHDVVVESALLYVGTTTNPSFVGPMESVEALARHIWVSRGPSGMNKDYLYGLAKALEAIGGERDEHITELESIVRRLDAQALETTNGRE
eukprot:jgi/Hompol1/6427/HPOL_002156-RA